MKYSILYLGANGFPKGQALVQRQIAISQLLAESGARVWVVSRKGTQGQAFTNSGSSWRGRFGSIQYFTASFSTRYYRSYLLRNGLKVIGFFVELAFIVYMRMSTKRVLFLVNAISIHQLRWYKVLASVLCIPLIYDLVEWIDDLEVSKGANRQFLKHLTRQADGVVCISRTLEQVMINMGYKGKLFRLPAITSFSRIESISPAAGMGSPYFLYCGSASYVKSIALILEAHANLMFPEVKLIMIVNGSQRELSFLSKLMESGIRAGRVIHYKNLRYEELIGMYKSALALLIPLDAAVRAERARFPHKLAEYCASKRPIVTTRIDEVEVLFRAGESAYIAERFEARDLEAELNTICREPLMAGEVGRRGYEVGKKMLDIQSYREAFPEYIRQFVN